MVLIGKNMWRYRNAAHYLVGMITAMSSQVHWTLPLVSVIFFLAYEVDEDYHISDEAFRDILEATIGFFATVTALIIWRFII